MNKLGQIMADALMRVSMVSVNRGSTGRSDCGTGEDLMELPDIDNGDCFIVGHGIGMWEVLAVAMPNLAGKGDGCFTMK